MSETYTTVFEAGEGDGYWKIEETPDGTLYVSSNAETRRLVEPANHIGWDGEAFRAGMRESGVPEELIERYALQGGM